MIAKMCIKNLINEEPLREKWFWLAARQAFWKKPGDKTYWEEEVASLYLYVQ